MGGGPLGQALEPRQLLATGASFLTWTAAQRAVAGPLLAGLFGADLWASRTEEQRRRCGIAVTSGLFSVAAVLVGTLGLLFPAPAVAADPIYGYSELVQGGAAMVVGFFAWNLLAENLNSWAGWPNVVHHLCCLVCFVFVQHPFSPRVACALMLFEASTPALCTFNVLKNFGLESTPLYRVARVLFVVLFFTFRLALGIPLTALWYADMLALARDGGREVHSAPVFYISLALPIPFLAVNFFWFSLIARAVARKGRGYRGRSA